MLIAQWILEITDKQMHRSVIQIFLTHPDPKTVPTALIPHGPEHNCVIHT